MELEKNTLIEIAKDCADVEIYTADFNHYRGFHSDFISGTILSLSDLPDEFIGDYEIMDEEDYNNSVLANSCMSADFKDWYSNKNAKVLVINLPESHIKNGKYIGHEK